MKLIHLSATHLLARRGETLYGLDPHARLAEAIDSVVRRHADAEACLVTGDLTDAGSDAACRDLAGLLARLPMPVHLLPGNHDDRAALLRHFPSMQRDAGGFLQGAVELSLGRLLLLDSVDAGRPQGCYCAARLDWLDGQLRRAERDDVPLWLALHHPPMDSGIVSMDRYGMPGERPRALDELLHPLDLPPSRARPDPRGRGVRQRRARRLRRHTRRRPAGDRASLADQADGSAVRAVSPVAAAIAAAALD